ncbi:S1 family peptidase [Streptomyces sp. NPDC059637]|uniref:S1 family peptidase n=1 Tax=Streptomyces sp. NPDC059637 TaxID=3347752 RepID=UPI00369FC39A
MQHRRVTKRRTVIAGAGATAVAAAAILLPNANAVPTGVTAPGPKALTPHAAVELASTLVEDLGSGTAGSYYDERTDRLTVNVVDAEAAEDVRRAGAVARIVENSTAELRSARAEIGETAEQVPGTAWAVDPRTNRVVVTADTTVTGKAWDRLEQAVDALGGKAVIKKAEGEFKPFVSGGDAIHSGGGRCSLGFNVTVDGAPAFITAGHCGDAGSSWEDGQGSAIGTMDDSQFPENDYALVKYADASADAPSEVNLYDGGTQRITGAAEATVGMAVKRSGSTTQVHDGKVTGLNATVNYGSGQIVNGLIQTDVCAEPGDSGGSLFAGESAVGLTSGGSGDCSSGGTTFFQPVTEALSAYGAQIG